LKSEWKADHTRWQVRDLSARSYVYLWADAIYFQGRMEDARQCMLVLIGATPMPVERHRDVDGLQADHGGGEDMAPPSKPSPVVKARRRRQIQRRDRSEQRPIPRRRMITRHPNSGIARNRCLRTRMSNKPLSVDLALIKAKTFAKKGAPDQAMQLYQAVLKRFPGNKRAIEGLKSLTRPKPNREQIVLNKAPTQEQINGLIALYNQGRNQEVLDQGTALAEQYPNVPLIPNILGAVNAGFTCVDKNG
jgi:hypothetical protein